MQHIIEKLLILQDRDRRILRIREQLARIEPERQLFQSRAASAQAGLDTAKLKVKQAETDRKKFELEAESKKQQIEKYALQQFQTKKNEEYRALAHEIETCKEAITHLEDKQLELMEQIEAHQKQAAAAAREAEDSRKVAESQLKNIAAGEQNLRSELSGLESNRDQLTAAIEERALRQYERLLRSKGDNVVVGIQHGVCGGCHMKFPVQLVVSCQAAKEMVTCPNCGRILYYTRDMDLAVAD
jgi:predicted  nucleic acid-binding Zn-ribbon protein